MWWRDGPGVKVFSEWSRWRRWFETSYRRIERNRERTSTSGLTRPSAQLPTSSGNSVAHTDPPVEGPCALQLDGSQRDFGPSIAPISSLQVLFTRSGFHSRIPAIITSQDVSFIKVEDVCFFYRGPRWNKSTQPVRRDSTLITQFKERERVKFNEVQTIRSAPSIRTF